MPSPISRAVSVVEQLESRLLLSVAQWDASIFFRDDGERAASHAALAHPHATPMRIRPRTAAGFVHSLESFPYAQGSPSSAVVGNLAYFGGFQTSDSPNS